ncbi:MAG TPA: TRAP transporter substrate-binding protein [Ferrovibrio sp.]|uniref:TRAP transporter substrate-binding protein n=1 Tax=Ferrovibrio sp. TaxID=1917215 RepID=UPI002B4B6907|nr:TRAP transporter substrate-binding protein [Ferrovibrio sp.]HLT76345.1 TRAP transporter substrate-binding protein [Ferrovibrio sp.]
MRTLLLGLGFSAALIGAAAAQELPATQLKLIGGISVTTQSRLLERPFWTEKVPQLSNGSIKIDFKPFNEIGLKGPEVLRLVQRDVADGSTPFLGHMAGDVPINEGVDLAGLSPSFELFRKVSETFRPVIAEHYEKELGLKLLGLWSYQAQVLFCREPLNGLADLKGRKIRTSSATQADFVGYFGASGIPMPIGETQQALVTGVIDCGIVGTLGAYQLKWGEGAKSVYSLPVTWGSIAFVMSKKKWDSLDPKVQGFLTTNLKKLEDDIWALNDKEHQVGIECNTNGPCSEGKPAGMKLTTPTPADEALRREAMLKAVLPAWAKRCGAQCVSAWNGSVGKLVDLTASAN